MSYGLRPVTGLSGGYQSSGFTEYAIADGNSTTMYTGGLGVLGTTGYITQLAVFPTGLTAAASTIGVFGGFRYEDSDGTPVYSQRYVGHADNEKAFAYVYDDPRQLFVCQGDEAIVQADIGMNVTPISDLVGGTSTEIETGRSDSGLSNIALDISATAATSSLCFRIVGIQKDGESEDSASPNVIVRFRGATEALASPHFMDGGLGLA